MRSISELLYLHINNAVKNAVLSGTVFILSSHAVRSLKPRDVLGQQEGGRRGGDGGGGCVSEAGRSSHSCQQGVELSSLL